MFHHLVVLVYPPTHMKLFLYKIKCLDIWHVIQYMYLFLLFWICTFVKKNYALDIIYMYHATNDIIFVCQKHLLSYFVKIRKVCLEDLYKNCVRRTTSSSLQAEVVHYFLDKLDTT